MCFPFAFLKPLFRERKKEGFGRSGRKLSPKCEEGSSLEEGECHGPLAATGKSGPGLAAASKGDDFNVAPCICQKVCMPHALLSVWPPGIWTGTFSLRVGLSYGLLRPTLRTVAGREAGG
jgi:hypothetical protein